MQFIKEPMRTGHEKIRSAHLKLTELSSGHSADLCSVLVRRQPTLHLWFTASYLTHERKAFVIKGKNPKPLDHLHYITYQYCFQTSEAVEFIVLGILVLLHLIMATR